MLCSRFCGWFAFLAIAAFLVGGCGTYTVYNNSIDRSKWLVSGDLSDPAGWLKVNQIDHVLWLKNDAKMPAGTFDRLNAQIGQDYYWREFYVAGDFHVGVWSRRPR